MRFRAEGDEDLAQRAGAKIFTSDLTGGEAGMEVKLAWRKRKGKGGNKQIPNANPEKEAPLMPCEAQLP
eukprot:s2427_g19.t1